MTGSIFVYHNKAAIKADCRYLLLCCHLPYLAESIEDTSDQVVRHGL